MKLFRKFALPWGSDLPSIQAEAINNPQIIQSEISSLEKTLSKENPTDKATAASTIRTAITGNPSVGLNTDVFEVILRACNDDQPSVRQPLVESLGKIAPVVDGDARRQLVASSHILTNLLEREDEHTITWALPAVSEAVQEYSDPFINHADAIALGLDSNEDLIVTSAVETLARIAEENHASIVPHLPALRELQTNQDTITPYQHGQAMRAIALVLTNAPSGINKEHYAMELKSMHSKSEPVAEQFAVRSMGYLLSSEPEVWEEYNLLPCVIQSLLQHDSHIRKDAAIACLRIIRNTDLDLLSDPDVVEALHKSIEEYNLRDQLQGVEKVADSIKANMLDDENT